MPTGLLIRDFFKQYRELRFTNSGSFELSEIEHNAYLNRLTIEIDSIDAPRYANNKTNPRHTHFGYLTTFKGSSVLAKVPIEFVRQRVLETINQGVWDYHQATESVGLADSGLAVALDYYLESVLPDVAADYEPGWVIRELVDSSAVGEFGLEWYARILEAAGGLGDAIPNENQEYRAYPIASPYPDIFKFKADVPVSFRFRLESWFLVSPAIYIADNPTDTDDETEGEDEYPEPELGDGDGDGSEFPEPDPIPSGRDPRDFPSGSGSTDWFEGAQARVRYTRYPYAESCTPLTASDEIVVGAPAAGTFSFEYIGSVNGCDGPQTAGGLRLLVPGGAPVQIAVLEEQQWQLATVDSVVYFTP